MSKEALRTELRTGRERLSGAEYVEASTGVNDQLLLFISTRPAMRDIHTFLPMKDRHEPDIYPALDFLYDSLLLNLYTSVIDETGQLVTVEYHPGQELVAGRFGVPVPAEAKPVDHSLPFDLILVPVVGFDRLGNRLGYGAGQYDGFLQSQPDTFKLGIAFDVCRTAEFIPKEPHDVPLDAVITETGMQHFSF